MGKGDTYPMKININAVTPNTVDIHGQTVTREYAERVLLPLLVASKGENHSGIIQVVCSGLLSPDTSIGGKSIH